MANNRDKENTAHLTRIPRVASLSSKAGLRTILSFIFSIHFKDDLQTCPPALSLISRTRRHKARPSRCSRNPRERKHRADCHFLSHQSRGQVLRCGSFDSTSVFFPSETRCTKATTCRPSCSKFCRDPREGATVTSAGIANESHILSCFDIPRLRSLHLR
jgi:hypothetical protein